MRSGTRIGPYQIASSIGAGGMGEVFRGRDTRLNRDVAVKVLPRDLAASGDRLRRFEQEAKTLAALNHPNILTIHDAGVHDGAPYLITELLEGNTLRDELKGGALPVHKATEYALQIAHGLVAAHGKGVIHRDLKPENIFVTKDGRVKILDFGLAKLNRCENELDADAGTVVQPEQMTQPGAVLGTPSYMAPEQVRSDEVDQRTDLFAFGAILYEMLSGQRAFRRNTAVETMHAILKEEPAELLQTNAKIPAVLDRIVERCLQKDPERRFQSAADLRFALESLSGGATPGPRPGVPSAEVQPPDARTQKGWRITLSFIVLLVVASSVVLFPKFRSRSGSTVAAGRIASLAVKPLDDFFGDTNNAFLSDGMTEALCSALGNLSALRVPGRSSVMRYKGGHKSIQEMAKDLKVDAIIEGSIQKSGSRILVTVQLVEAATDRHLWSMQYERDLSDFFKVQSELARAVAAEIKVRVAPEDYTRLTHASVAKAEAVEAYLKGRYHWNKRTKEGFKRGLEYFQQAIDADPNYALAYTGIAFTYILLGHELYSMMSPRDAYVKAKAAALKAIELDDAVAEAHTVLAWCHYRDEWDWAAAEREQKHAIDLDPNDATVHQYYSHYLLPTGQVQASLVESRRALELDPLSLIINTHLGWHYFYARDFDRAIHQLEATLDMSPDFAVAILFLGQAYEQKGRFDEAIAVLHKGVDLSRRNPVHVAALAHVCATSGRRMEAEKLFEELKETAQQRYVPSYEIAVVCAGLDYDDQAFAWLERAYEQRDSSWLVDLAVDPRFGRLRQDLRFAALLKKIGLEK